ncbi:MAG: YdcF family protein [Actinomycetes bacterium]
MHERTLQRAPDQLQVVRRDPKPYPGWRAMVMIMIFVIVVFPVIVAVGSWSYVNSVGQANDRTKTDAIVVLGAAQFNGTPSPVLRARLAHALDLYQSGIAPRIITVGGNQPGDQYTEAGAGRQWLIEQGVPQSDVVAVKTGSDTLGSLQSVATVAEQNGWTSITVDSDPAHMARSMAMAHRIGFDAHANPTKSGDGSTLTDEYVFRETGAYLAFEVLGQWGVDRGIG